MPADDGFAYVTASAFLFIDPNEPSNDVPVPNGVAVEWELLTVGAPQGSGQEIVESDSVFTDGYAGVKFKTSTTAGDQFQIKVKVPLCNIEATSGVFQVVPGFAANIQFATVPSLILPIEGEEFTITAEVRDAFGNFVEDGTEVLWMDAGLTALTKNNLDIGETVQGGVVQAKMIAGAVVDQSWVALMVDNFEATYDLNLTPIQVTLFSDLTELDVEAPSVVAQLRAIFKHSNGLNIPAGTSISWMTTNGTIQNADSVVDSNGEAFAELSTVGGHRGFATVGVVLGTGGGSGILGVGDAATKGDITFTSSALVSSEMCPGRWIEPDNASSQCTLKVKGPPNGTAQLVATDAELSLVFFDCRSILTVGLLKWLKDTAFGAGSYGHDALISGTNPTADATLGLQCDGQVSASVAPTELLRVPQGLFVSLTIKVETADLPANGETKDLIQKAGQYAIRLVNDGSVRIQLEVVVQDGVLPPVSNLLKSDPLTGGPEYSIEGSFFLGVVRLQVSGLPTVESQTLAGIIPVYGLTALSPLVIGGSFVGYIRDVRVKRRRRVIFAGTALSGNVLQLDGAGEGEVFVQPETPADQAEDPSINPEDADLGIYRFQIGISVFDGVGAPVEDVEESIYAIRQNMAKSLKDGLGEMGAALQHAGKTVIEVVLPIQDLRYLASLPVGNEFDLKKTVFALGNVGLTFLGPIAKGGKLVKLLAPGKGAAVMSTMIRGAMKAQTVSGVIVFAELLDFGWQLGEAFYDKLMATVQSERALEEVNELYEEDI